MTDQTSDPETSSSSTPAPAAVTPDCVTLLSVPGGIPDLDADLKAAMANATGVLKVRLPLSLFAEGVDEQYNPWRKVAWIVEFRQPAMAKEFREGLDDFIRAWVAARVVGQRVNVTITD